MRAKYFLLLLVIFINFTACADIGEDTNEMNNVQINSVSTEEISKLYTEEQLNEIIQQKTTIEKLTAQFPTEYICEIDDGYRAVYYGKNLVAVVIFDQNKMILFGRIYSCSNLKSEYEKLQIGNTLSDVQTIDSKGEYLFLYTGRNDTPKESTHYTSDKYVINITYDENNLISNIIIEEI